MPEVHQGGCACGAVRYRVTGEPFRSGICNCTFCQRRTGSAFGIGVYFKEEAVEITQGTLKAFEHVSDESNRWLRLEFCTTCGTTVTWTVEAGPGARAIAGGTFDDPSWLKMERQSWARSALPWVNLSPDIEKFSKAAL